MTDPTKAVEEALGLVDVITSQCQGKQPEMKPTLARLRRVLEGLADAGQATRRIDLSSEDLSTTHFLARIEGSAAVFTLLDKDIISDLPFQRVRETMKTIVGADGPRHCIVDLSKVRFISSVPVGGIVTLNRETLAHHHKLLLCAAQPPIREFFRVTKLDTIIAMTDSVDEALTRTA